MFVINKTYSIFIVRNYTLKWKIAATLRVLKSQ